MLDSLRCTTKLNTNDATFVRVFQKVERTLQLFLFFVFFHTFHIPARLSVDTVSACMSGNFSIADNTRAASARNEIPIGNLGNIRFSLSDEITLGARVRHILSSRGLKNWLSWERPRRWACSGREGACPHLIVGGHVIPKVQPWLSKN
ncbi:hypothetical protein AVEN_159600-1 [Araneus ventricosus]|uniref:Uncharacterized protein n=1 Tax=Araneus ventricosus TaxID=182803 RepID=A0A4Y2VYC1_ARAVE|nr:hypothetical protein AVEN_159600-1 [Araneus ventricosus]